MTDDIAPDLTAIAAKLDRLIQNDDLHIFDTNEVLILLRVIEAWRDAEGYVRITKKVGIVLAFIVVLWTQWDRLIELIAGLGSKP